MTGILVGSSDLDRVKAHRSELKKGHAERMSSISMMSFSIKRPRIIKHGPRAYIEVFGKRLYLKDSEADKAKDAGYAVYYE